MIPAIVAVILSIGAFVAFMFPHLWYPLVDRLYPSWLIYRYKLATPLSYQLRATEMTNYLSRRLERRTYPKPRDLWCGDPEYKQRERMAEIQRDCRNMAIVKILDRVEMRMCL